MLFLLINKIMSTSNYKLESLADRFRRDAEEEEARKVAELEAAKKKETKKTERSSKKLGKKK